MPSAVSFLSADGADSNIRGGNEKARTRCLEPLVNSGLLKTYPQKDLTPVIGTEFEGLQVKELLTADEQVIKDLAVTSKSPHLPGIKRILTVYQFLNEESSSYEIKM